MRETDESFFEKCRVFLETLQLITIDPMRLAILKRKLYASGDSKRNVFAENLMTSRKIADTKKKK
jgi:hypothetical protein